MSTANLKGGLFSATNQKNFTFSLDTPSVSSGTLDKYLQQVLGGASTTNLPEMLRSTGNLTDMTSQPTELPLKEEPITHPIINGPEHLPISNGPTPVNVTTVQRPSSTTEIVQASIVNTLPQPSNTLVTTNTEGGEVIPLPKGQAYLDITEYLNMPQSEAAKKLGIPPSTLSKRWKEAVRKRKWPYRMVGKIDKEIMTLLHNVPQGANAPPLPEEIEQALGQLLRKRQEELRPVVIRI